MALVCYIEHALLSTDMVLMMQYAAHGQQGLEFLSEQHGPGDSAREDIQCHVLGHALEPSEISVHKCIASPADPDGIHSNKEGLSKAGLIIYALWLLHLLHAMSSCVCAQAPVSL